MRSVLPALFLFIFISGCQMSEQNLSSPHEQGISSSLDTVLDIGGLSYQVYDEAGLTPRAITIAHMIASTDYCRDQLMASGRSDRGYGLLLGFDSGPEMGTDAPSPVYRYRLYRECVDMDQTHDWFIFDPQQEVLYVEDLIDGNHRALQMDPVLLAAFRTNDYAVK